MKRVLITGGTGSFGKALVQTLTQANKGVERIVVFSRDELKQWEMQKIYPIAEYPQVRFFLGDIRDRDRIRRALEGIDTVIHAAALKQVPAAEYNPMEFINTNVIGSENVVQACLDTGVRNVIALSTDKAAAPINLYGATKLCADKLFTAANNIKGTRDIKFSVVRYGNVMGSRGSVIPFFIDEAKKGILPITDKKMTRFNITLQEAVDLVMWAQKNAIGGEILVPKIPSYNILTLAKAIGPGCKVKHVGIRPGEKIHEEMITSSDAPRTLDLGSYYSVVNDRETAIREYSRRGIKATPVAEGFRCSSEINTRFLDIEEIRKLIRGNLDPMFSPAESI